MSVRVFYEILNQRGTPAMFTDTLANRPAFGYNGRLFVSTDSGQIFEDTGSAWTLVADAGVGGGTLSSVCLNGNTTATGIVITAGGLSTNSLTDTALTAGSILYAGSGGLISQSNSTFFWDATNNRLGIGINAPGAPLDIHATGTNAQFNGTGSNNAYLQFQNAGVSKWRIGNTYNGAANSFDIYNNGLTNTPFSINSSTNAITLSANVTTTGEQFVLNGLYLGYASGGANINTTTLLGSTNGINFLLGNGTGGANFIFQTLAGYNYTFPAATGTLALTSNLSSYVPYTGATQSVNLGGYGITASSLSVTNNSTFNSNLLLNKVGLGITTPSYVTQFAASSGVGIGYSDGTGGANFILQTASIYNYTFPSTSGTVALTSNLSSYLPLSGGTLTGALNGTSASFSSSVTANGLGGTINSCGGSGSGITLANGSINSTQANSEDDILLNNVGYNSGTTQFRNFRVYDGKGNIIFRTFGSTGNFTIGTTTDNGSRLQVSGSGTFSTQVAIGTTVIGGYPLLLKAASGDTLIYGSSSNGSFNFDSYIDGTSGQYHIRSGSCDVYLPRTAGTWIGNSDKTIKENIILIPNSLDKVMNLNGYTYNLIDDKEHSLVGVIAQEVREVLPQAVHTSFSRKYNKEILGVEYDVLIPLLINAIKELNEKLVRNNIN